MPQNLNPLNRERREENLEKEVRNAADGSVLPHESLAARCRHAVPRRRLLRNVRRGCRQDQRHIGHHADPSGQRCRFVCRTGGISLSCARHLPAQTPACGRTGGHLRAAGRPQDGQGIGQAGYHRVGHSGRRHGEQHALEQGEHLPRLDILRQKAHGRRLSRYFDRRILRRRGFRCLCRQTAGQPAA